MLLKRIALTAFALLAALPLAAVECKTLVTLVPNVAERLGGILPGRSVSLPSVTRVAQMQTFHLHLFLRDAVVKDGRVRVGVRILIRDAAGKISFDSRDSIKVLELPVSAPGKQLLHPSGCRVVLGKDKAPGEYTVEAEVTDFFAGNSTGRDTAKVTLIASPQEGKAFHSRQEVLNFMQNYYRKPEPDRIVPALRFWAGVLPELRKEGKGQPVPLYSWFYFALKQNAQWLKPFAEEIRNMEKPDQSGAALVLLALSGKKGRELFEVAEVKHPWQLDVLWNEFFVTGGKAPVIKISGQIWRLAVGMRPEEFKALANPADADRAKVMDNLIGRSALWRLHSFARTHELTAGYLSKQLAEKKIQDGFTAEAVLRMVRPELTEPAGRTLLPAALEE